MGSKLEGRSWIVAFRGSLLITIAGVLAACGGGGSSGGGSGPIVSPPTAPRFTSSSNASVTENESGSFYTATATDPQGDTISFSIQGGVDAGNFVLESGGRLRFDVAANFDKPRDQNQDNVYQVILRATAGGETVDLPLNVTITNDKEGIAVRRIATGFKDPVGLSMLYDEQRLLIAEAGGRVAIVDGATGVITERDDIEAAMLPGEIVAAGYGGHNQAFIEGAYFLTHSPIAGLQLQLYNFRVQLLASRKLDGPSVTPVTGSIFRGDTAAVMVAVGDTGGNRAQDDSSAYGKLWSSYGYDPYAGASLPPTPSVFVSKIGSGVGHPVGGGIARGESFFADRGATIEDELTFFRSIWRPLDFGWPFYEGYSPVKSSPPALLNGPTLTYPRGDGAGSGKGIVAGVLYESTIAGIRNHFVFGDIKGRIWSIPWSVLKDGFRHNFADLEDRTLDFTPDQGKIDAPVAFEQTLDGTIYILDADGEVFRVDPGN